MRRLIVEADGGSRGNPGVAGCGAVVRDADTAEVLAERAEDVGVATNNVAEYRGLLAGLRAAAECAPDELLVRMDSKLVVEQMMGRWRVKHENLQPLAAQAKQLAADLPITSYEWIPRARNKHADQLANDAMDGKASTRSQQDGAPEPASSPSTGAVVDAAAAADIAQPSAAPAEHVTTSSAGSWLGAMGAPTRLLLLRHGQTEHSVDHRYSGRGDIELTELGLEQARAAARRVAKLDTVAAGSAEHPIAVVASPLTRTRQTAHEVATEIGGTCEYRDGLVETDFGEWEGLTFSDASQRYPQLHRQWLGDSTVAPPGGESFAAVSERVANTCSDLVQRYAGQTVVVVSHVTPIKEILRLGLDVGPSVFYRLHLDLASLSIVEFYADGNASVRLVNDTAHWS